MFCEEQVAQLRDVTDQIHAAGAELVVVGNGTPKQARWFIGDLGLKTPVYTDPTLEVYRAADAKRGLGSALRPSVFAHAFKAYRAGFRQKGVQGDATQLGGTFIIQRDGSAPFVYRSTVAGDAPDVDDVLSALRKLD